MEQLNLSDTDQFLTMGATSDESQSPKEAVTHVNAADNNNNVVNAVNAVTVTGAGSGSELAVVVTNSEAVGSGLVVKRGRGRPRKHDAVDNTASPLAVAPPAPGFSDQTKRGRGRPRGSGKLQVLASIGEFCYLFIICMFFL